MLLQCNYFYKCRVLFEMEGEYFYLDGCFATSSSHWSYSKPCAAVPAAWLFCFSHPYKSELLTSVQNKKARTVRAGFVTPSAGFWLRVYSLVFLSLLGFQRFTYLRKRIFAHPCVYKRTRCLNNVLPHFLILVSPL